ncbi:MAG: DUF3288 family protein [Spirulinaceae cyanobacterium]
MKLIFTKMVDDGVNNKLIKVLKKRTQTMEQESKTRDQKHPQESRDRFIVNRLLNGEANDYYLTELARLSIRYKNFPGARDIQSDLTKVLQNWQLTEEELFAKTREIHALGKVYQKGHSEEDREDWS